MGVFGGHLGFLVGVLEDRIILSVMDDLFDPEQSHKKCKILNI